MKFINELGPLAVGSRIKNLAELLMKDMARVYQDHGIEFEPRWFTLFQLIMQKEKISVTEIADELNQSHPAVVQVLNALEKKKLITTQKDRTDHRKRLVRLSKKGKNLAKELKPVWDDVLMVTNEILEEGAPDLLEKIAGIEKLVQQKSTYQRMTEKRIERIAANISFTAFSNEYHDDFRALNEDWLNTYLEITEYDKKTLMNPVREIIENNGSITLMMYEDRAIGSYALKRKENNSCELSKFTIHSAFRGMGLGKKLLNEAIEEARSSGYTSILLFTHHALVEASRLYKKTGFEEIREQPGMLDETGRCSMMMKLNINQ